jgi:hypothetical protein
MKQGPNAAQAGSQQAALPSGLDQATQVPAILPQTVAAVIKTSTASEKALEANLRGELPPPATTGAISSTEATAADVGCAEQPAEHGEPLAETASATPSDAMPIQMASSVVQLAKPGAVSIPLFPAVPAGQVPAAVSPASQARSYAGTMNQPRGLPPTYTVATLRLADQVPGSIPSAVPSVLPTVTPVGYTRPTLPIALASALTTNGAAIIPISTQGAVGAAVTNPAASASGGLATPAPPAPNVGAFSGPAKARVQAPTRLPPAMNPQISAVSRTGGIVQPLMNSLLGGDAPAPAVTVPGNLASGAVPVEPLVSQAGADEPLDGAYEVGTAVPADALIATVDPAIQGKYDLPFSMTGGGTSGTVIGLGDANLAANTRGSNPASAPAPAPTGVEVVPAAVQIGSTPYVADPAGSSGYGLPSHPGGIQSEVQGGTSASFPPPVYPSEAGSFVVPVINVGNSMPVPGSNPYLGEGSAFIPLSSVTSPP